MGPVKPEPMTGTGVPEIKLPEGARLLTMSIVGSTAYGLAGPDSDLDYLGVFAVPTQQLLGLDGHKLSETSVVQNDPDVTVHELGKWVRLALAANPTVLELLFATSIIRPANGWQVLRHYRRDFMGSETILASYGGYAIQQAKRVVKRHGEGKHSFNSDLRNRIAKHGRHSLRLLLQAEQLLSTGDLDLDVSKHRDLIFSAGTLAVENPELFENLFRQRLDALHAIRPVIPARPDRHIVNSVLVQIRTAL